MDKKALIGIGLVTVIFIAFTWFNSNIQQKKLAQQKAQQEQVAETATEAPRTTEAEIISPEEAAEAAAERREESVAQLGERLTAAREETPRTFTVENEVLRVRFSTLGGRIEGVTLKDYTRYAEGERTEPIEMFDAADNRFALNFFIKNGLRNYAVNTMDYTFEADAPTTTAEGAQQVTMRLMFSDDAWLEYCYLIYNSTEAARNYLVDFKVRFVNTEAHMATQASLNIDWANSSFQNERGFKNENMYTTVAWHHPGESAIEELSMSDSDKSDEVKSSVDWVAFKQQFFSSAFIAPDHFRGAKMGFTTAQPGSGYMKHFAAKLTVPYSPQTTDYNFAFYFGPNKYSILNHVAVSEESGKELHMERLIPLGWGIFGWINRWCVIPVFDFLRNYIGSFGIIILILAVLIRLIISPLTYKSYVSMAKMRLIKPQIDELNKKFPKQEDAMKKQQATMELYKKAGINPMGGCIPMLIQMPILIAMFRFFPASIELRGEAFLWSHDLSSFDSVLQLPFNIPFYGDHISLFALLMALSTFAYSYYNYQQTASSQPQMAGMKFMMVYMMPIMLLCWFNGYASGLCYYYLLSNILTIGQTLLIRQMVDDRKIHAAMEANAAKQSKGKKSKFQLRYEELMRQQEELQRNKKR